MSYPAKEWLIFFAILGLVLERPGDSLGLTLVTGIHLYHSTSWESCEG